MCGFLFQILFLNTQLDRHCMKMSKVAERYVKLSFLLHENHRGVRPNLICSVSILAGEKIPTLPVCFPIC